MYLRYSVCSVIPSGEEGGEIGARQETNAVEGGDITIEDVTGDQDQQQGLEETQPLSAIEPDGPPTGVSMHIQ